MTAPLAFDPSFETPEADEAQTTAQLVETLHGISATTSKDYGHAVRSLHAKGYGLLQGELRVFDNLAPHLAQGLFAAPATYPLVMRFSTAPGDILDDSISSPRGLAIKLTGVPGPRLPGADGQTTQDFLFVNGPAFAASSAKAFLKSLKLLAKTVDAPQGWKKALSAALRGAEAAVEAAGGQSSTLISMGGQPLTHILGETFYTQAPLLYGQYMAKLSCVPVAPALQALVGTKVDVSGKPNAFRDAIVEFFSKHSGAWELRAQLCTDLASMPIEDASVAWPEDQSPYVPVARITIPPQRAWSEAQIAAIEEGMAFSPWHGLAAHRPLGSIMRVRKATYEASAQFRSQHNGCPIHEPQTVAGMQA